MGYKIFSIEKHDLEQKQIHRPSLDNEHIIDWLAIADRDKASER